MKHQELVELKQRIMATLHQMDEPKVDGLIRRYRAALASISGGTYRLEEAPTQEQVIYSDIIAALQHRKDQLVAQRTRPMPENRARMASAPNSGRTRVIALVVVGIVVGYLLFK